MTTAGDLILSAYKLANIKDANEELEAYEAADGLEFLNTIIDQWSSLQIYIPTFNLVQINTVSGTYQYDVSPIIVQILEASYYDSNGVKDILTSIDLKKQNVLNYNLGAQSPGRPSVVFLQNAQANVPTANSTIFFSPVPDAVYNVTLYAKQIMGELLYSTDILNIPRRNFKAIKFQLAKDLSLEYNTELSPEFQPEYTRIMRELKAANKKDMSVQTNNEFRSNRFYRPWNIYAG